MAINCLLENCYFNERNYIFHENSGILVGSDQALFIVDLFLYYYPGLWVSEHFWQNFSSELDLKKENASDMSAIFLENWVTGFSS